MNIGSNAHIFYLIITMYDSILNFSSHDITFSIIKVLKFKTLKK